MIKVTYKGVDITDSVSINQCIHDMYAEGQTDTLRIRFNDVEHVWDQWNPQPDDEITVEYGAIKTGKMFVHRATAANGLFEIIATSAPASSKDKKSKAWQKIKFLNMAREIAEKHGLGFEAYGVQDILYEYIMQQNESDFAFLNQRCILEGCAFLVYDGKLVLYSQSFMESLAPSETVSIGTGSNYEYSDKSGDIFGSCKIEQGLYRGEFAAKNGATNVLIPGMDISINSNAEAARFAQNCLREANKKAYTGTVYSEILPGYAAASMMQLETERAPSWNGKVFITHLRNDYGKGYCKIFFRRPLEGY